MAWTRYTDKITSFETRSYVGRAFYIRSFCDDPTGTTYLSKAPVCKLSLDPTTQLVDTNIAWDISESSHSTGTIDTFDIDWEGTTDIGDLSDQDWSSDPKSGNVQFTEVGIYTVEATVTDTLGKESSPCKIEVEIVPDDETEANQKVFIGTTDDGLYTRTPTVAPTSSNTGLSGLDLNFRNVHVHPAYMHLPLTAQHLWAATEDGVAYSTDGGSSWSIVDWTELGDPENAYADDPAPTAGELDQIDICFDPQDENRVYLYRSTDERVWLYYTDDYGETWSNEQVLS